ncbi:MAG TPA: flagellar type III secretion system pore protein FliP [Candidatus Gastranaerophilaceae bacterium]|nr:flagellar type III secretion system pore protein FliP [Candidatus Gastranaerophilaceae bacterium]HPT41026.1 flagellar type III secretion system pore protein FliP [Candidatus Gastranaerophilaceae bacterium]
MKSGILKKMLFVLAAMLLFVPMAHCAMAFPNINIGMKAANTPQDFSNGVQILIWMTILTLAPSIFIMATSFIRIIIVLALTRQAIGVGSLPPTQILSGLALILTFFIMSPTINKINETAIQPYMKNQITQQTALDKAIIPARDFMFKQTDEKNLALFIKMAKIEKPKSKKDVPTYILLPSFILSELNTAFKIGFVIFLPFLVIDIVVSSILVSMGMLFLPPTMIALPFKLIMFVMVDGWYLIVKSLVESFAT